MNPPDPDRSDAELHALFAGLRNQVITVVNAFSDRVMHRVEATTQREGPVWGGALSLILVEVYNLFAELATGPEAEPPGDDDGS